MKSLAYLICVFFAFLLFLPSLLMLSYKLHITKNDFRGTLWGYTDSHEKIVLSKSSYASREYQVKFEGWLDSTIPLREYYIRTYNQIQFMLFKQANTIIGKNNDFFDFAYISTECGLHPGCDFSISENFSRLENYINHLDSIQNKLERFDKYLLFYITPSKAALHFDNIPYKYRQKKRSGFKPPYFYLKEILSKKNINYIDSRDFLSQDNCPDFYTTGIHWARPVEQRVSKAIVENLSFLSKKHLPKIVLKDLKMYCTPVKRDADLFCLANLISKPHGIYYEYDAEICCEENSYKPKFLLQGGSFEEGLCFYDYAEYFKNNSFIFSYNNILKDNWIPVTNWGDLDFKAIIDQVDFVIIELNENVIQWFSNGFVEYLDLFLDSYKQTIMEEDCQ